MTANTFSEMCKSMAPVLANHLWQSTLFAVAAGLLALRLRDNHARTRYLLWLTASIKFLVPFSLLTGVGSRIAWWHGSVPANSGVYMTMDQLSRPFSESRLSLLSETAPVIHSAGLIDLLPALLGAVWLCGIAVVLLARWVRWRRIAAVVRKAASLRGGLEMETLRRLERATGMSKPIEMRVSVTYPEPGIFGIFRPALLWPRGISERLGNGHLEAILAHELCHVRRRDNLSAAIHMAVEAIFWFHPMVWWMGARLIEERERACDEQVLEMGSDRQTYAESILKICEFCVRSPLALVSGVTGSDLKKRIVQIMAKNVPRKLDFSRKLLLGASGLAAFALPFLAGFFNATQSRAHSQDWLREAIPPVYEAVSIKPTTVQSEKSGMVSGRMKFQPAAFIARNVTLEELIRTIYGVEAAEISGGPDWFKTEKFDLDAKWGKSVLDALKPLNQAQLARERKRMLQALLAERFQLALHFETQHLPAYALLIAPSGSKLHEAIPGDTYSNGFNDPDGHARGGMMHFEKGQIVAQGVPMALLVRQLARELSQEFGGSAIEDKTGLKGVYDFTLEWTPEESQPSLFSGAEGGQPGARGTGSGWSARPSLFTALEEQLGLQLQSQNGPAEILVIDHVERPPETQSHNTYARAPVFLETSVRRNESGNDLRAVSANYDALKITNFTLRMLILKAYGVQGFQLSGGPEWVDSETFDVEAKLDGVRAEALGKLNSEQRSHETLRMLQSLLADRFNLSLHQETEQIPIYALVIAPGGPKFREAIPGDTYPNGITGLYGRPIGGGGISEPERGKLVGQGCAIAYLVDVLSQDEIGGLGRVVVNKTGLSGNYDFTLKWTPEARKSSTDRQQAKYSNYSEFFNSFPKNSRGASAQVPAAGFPGLSVFPAIQEQLGLKLESQSAPLEVLVIDHAEKPVEK